MLALDRSEFHTTTDGLQSVLQSLQIGSVTLCGLGPKAPSIALACRENGYHVSVVTDCCAFVPPSPSSNSNSIKMAERIIFDELNARHVDLFISTEIPAEQSDEQYCKKHSIDKLFHNLLASLLSARPGDPLEFLESQLSQQSGQVASPITESDIETVFKAYDPLGVGTVSAAAARRALLCLGAITTPLPNVVHASSSAVDGQLEIDRQLALHPICRKHVSDTPMTLKEFKKVLASI